MASQAVSTRSPDGADGEGFAKVLQDWRTQGRTLVLQHRGEFEELLDRLDAQLDAGRLADAAAAAQVAAAYAVFWHPGIFVSHRLERALRRIGAGALGATMPRDRPRAAGKPLRVLHVASQVAPIGGHTRNIQRWIDADTGAVHSLCVTRQTRALPPALSRAIAASGGTASCANAAIGGPLAWAAALGSRMAAADIVFLHVDNQDIVPFVALAGMTQRPPVALLNHADHVLWLGADFVDAVVSTRQSGHRLCADRRDIPADRNLTLPLCLDPVARTLDRADAKRALGIDPEDIVLLTIARSVKFRPIGGVGFADALLPVLRADPRVRLVAVGPGAVADWSAARAQVPGRILALPETPDTGRYLDAADIYIDSFPFASNTSLLEAGLHGLPLVTRQPFGPGCEIMGADSFGMDGCLQTCRSPAEFQAVVCRLVRDPAWRRELGTATRAGIMATNMGEGFRSALDALYARVLDLPRRQAASGPDPVSCLDDVDLFSHFVFGHSGDRETIRTAAQRHALAVEISLRSMPPWSRLGAWVRLARGRSFTFRNGKAVLKYLVPEWLTVRARLARTGCLVE